MRRLQSVVLSPMALINAWYIKNPPWKQVERAANNAGRLAPGWEEVEAKCRSVMELRMRLIPYLHAAFVEYHRRGLPPFRALVMDYPGDPADLADRRSIHDGRVDAGCAGCSPGEPSRGVYLPEGDWFDFWSGKRTPESSGSKSGLRWSRFRCSSRAGTILPLAEATGSTADAESWRIEAQVYGASPAPAVLYEDDGSEVRLSWNRAGTATGARQYHVTGWKSIA